MKKSIPNILTLGNLTCGVLAIRAIFNEAPVLALVFVAIAAFLDFFDGLVARLLGVSGELGKQLDSLADNVTFGVVPGVMLLSMGGFLTENPTQIFEWIVFAACLLVPALAALRLAMFNIDTRQSNGFIGMPTPGNTLLIAALYYLFFTDENSFVQHLFNQKFGLFALSLIAAIWQVLPIPLLALKFKTWDFKTNIWRYTFLITALLLLVVFQIEGIPMAIITYFLYSILANSQNKSNIAAH